MNLVSIQAGSNQHPPLSLSEFQVEASESEQFQPVSNSGETSDEMRTVVSGPGRGQSCVVTEFVNGPSDMSMRRGFSAWNNGVAAAP